MSEEEKKAIERIKRQQETTYELRKNKLWYDIEIVLNLIKKQQKEIEELHKEINRRIKLKIENEHIVDTMFIPKSKIEELQKQVRASLYHFKDSDKNNIVQRLYDRLEELLEEE